MPPVNRVDMPNGPFSIYMNLSCAVLLPPSPCPVRCPVGSGHPPRGLLRANHGRAAAKGDVPSTRERPRRRQRGFAAGRWCGTGTAGQGRGGRGGAPPLGRPSRARLPPIPHGRPASVSVRRSDGGPGGLCLVSRFGSRHGAARSGEGCAWACRHEARAQALVREASGLWRRGGTKTCGEGEILPR